MASFGGVGRELEGSAGVSRHAVSALVSWSKSNQHYFFCSSFVFHKRKLTFVKVF
jgi:hypothetical protein